MKLSRASAAERIASVGPARVELSNGKKLKSSKNSLIFVWRTSSWQLTQNGLSLAVIEKLKEMWGMQSDKVRSLLLSLLRLWIQNFEYITSSKFWRKKRKARILKFQIQIKVLIKLEKKFLADGDFQRQKGGWPMYNDCAKNSVKAKWSSRGF